MPQANIDMTAIRQAMLRRGMGQTSLPATDQLSQAGGTTPGGGLNVPVAKPMVPTVPTAGTLGAVQVPQLSKAFNPVTFDEDTKRAAKVLMTKLMQYL